VGALAMGPEGKNPTVGRATKSSPAGRERKSSEATAERASGSTVSLRVGESPTHHDEMGNLKPRDARPHRLRQTKVLRPQKNKPFIFVSFGGANLAKARLRLGV